MRRERPDIPKHDHEIVEMGRGGLDKPKFGRESLDKCRESLCLDFRVLFRDIRDQTLVCPYFGDPRATDVQIFQTQTLGATMQLGSESRCSATLDATHVPTFQTLCRDFPDSNSRRDSATWF